MDSYEPMDADDNLFEFDELFEGEDLAEGIETREETAPARSRRDEHLAPGVDELDHLAGSDLTYGPPVPTRAALPPVVVALLLVVALANLALVGLTWKSLHREPDAARVTDAPLSKLGSRADLAAEGPGTDWGRPTRAPERERALARSLPGLSTSRDDAWAALDDAQRAMDAGEFVAARRALYSTLTVIDRVAATERRDLESLGSFLIAESYRRQAETLSPDEASASEDTRGPR